jgi:hypothetical protein
MYYKVLVRTGDNKLVSCMAHLLPEDLVRIYHTKLTHYKTPSFFIAGSLDNEVKWFLADENTSLGDKENIEVWECRCYNFVKPPNCILRPTELRNKDYLNRLWEGSIDPRKHNYHVRDFPKYTFLAKSVKLIKRVQ